MAAPQPCCLPAWLADRQIDGQTDAGTHRCTLQQHQGHTAAQRRHGTHPVVRPVVPHARCCPHAAGLTLVMLQYFSLCDAVLLGHVVVHVHLDRLLDDLLGLLSTQDLIHTHRLEGGRAGREQQQRRRRRNTARGRVSQPCGSWQLTLPITAWAGRHWMALGMSCGPALAATPAVSSPANLPCSR